MRVFIIIAGFFIAGFCVGALAMWRFVRWSLFDDSEWVIGQLPLIRFAARWKKDEIEQLESE